MARTIGKSIIPLLVIDESSRALGGALAGRTKLTKIVFLLQKLRPDLVQRIAGPGGFYAFEPFDYGPFSKELIDDLDQLRLAKLIGVTIHSLDSRGNVIEHVYSPTPEGSAAAHYSVASPADLVEIRKLVDRYAVMDRVRLVDLVHNRFPEFVRTE
jgi:hypothetical protein